VKTLVYVEVREGKPSEDSLGLLAKAASIGTAHAIVCGTNVRDHASLLAAHGASTVAIAENDALGLPLPIPHADAVISHLDTTSYDAVFLGSSILVADIAGSLVGRLEAGVNYDLTGVEVRDSELVGLRPALGDSVVVEVAWNTPVAVAVFRPGAFLADDVEVSGAEPATVDVAVTLSPAAGSTERVDSAPKPVSEASLSDAAVIVAGGRGIGSKDNLQLIRDLAKALDGAPAVSMPLVSNGWAPYAMQVGQTGSVVRPKLYIAAGISGQMQHKIGMERSGTIVAINSDDTAPIFGFCDLAVVADVLDVLPKLTALVNQSGSTTA